MFKALGIFVLFVFLFIVFGVGAVIMVVVRAFRRGKSYSPKTGSSKYNSDKDAEQASDKQFNKDEGEYVDFEEIEDNTK